MRRPASFILFTGWYAPVFNLSSNFSDERVLVRNAEHASGIDNKFNFAISFVINFFTLTFIGDIKQLQ